MRPIRLGADAREALAMMDAEDRALRYLATLPRDTAVLAAVKVAVELSQVWEVEMGEMIRRGDRRRVYLPSKDEQIWLDEAIQECRGNPNWRSCPVARVRDHIAGLSPDAAAFVAYKVAKWTCRNVRIK